MNCFVERYVLIVFIRVFRRTVFYAGCTPGAFFLQDVPWLFRKRYVEVSCLSFYVLNLGKGKDLDVGMPADLDQLGCEYSHRAVVGRKGLVELGHVAADAR